jgi:hypothetical protein
MHLRAIEEACRLSSYPVYIGCRQPCGIAPDAARGVGHPMGLLQAGGGACARWGGSVTSFSERDAEHVRACLSGIRPPFAIPCVTL